MAIGDGSALVGSNRAVLAVLLLAGWIGLTVLGSLLHLLAVVVRVRDFTRPMPAPRPSRDSAVAAVAAAAVAGVAVAEATGLGALRAAAGTALLLAYLLLAARIVALAATVLRSTRPSI